MLVFAFLGALLESEMRQNVIRDRGENLHRTQQVPRTSDREIISVAGGQEGFLPLGWLDLPV